MKVSFPTKKERKSWDYAKFDFFFFFMKYRGSLEKKFDPPIGGLRLKL